jgi:membrane-bound ClpP family serine protease
MEQTIQTILTDIATIKARQETDHGKIKEIKTITSPIHELVVSVKHLTQQMERQNSNMDKFVQSSKDSTKAQGERLGEVEKTNERLSLLLEKQDKRIEELETKITMIQAKGGKRWESVLEKVIMVITAAIIGYILVQIGITT